MGRTYAGVLGPVAFLTVLTRSLIDGGSPTETLQLAMICLFGFAGLGFVAGQIADMVVMDSIRARFAHEGRSPAAQVDQETN